MKLGSLKLVFIMIGFPPVIINQKLNVTLVGPHYNFLRNSVNC